jgi:hypothetical protein
MAATWAAVGGRVWTQPDTRTTATAAAVTVDRGRVSPWRATASAPASSTSPSR